MTRASRLSEQTRGRTLDHAASLYDILSPMVTLGREQRIQARAVELLDLSGECRILDVGCATGAFSRRIAEACPDSARSEVVGIDAAARMIEVAQARHGDQPNLRFEAALAEKLPFEAESFDGAISSFFFHHVDAELKLECLNEIWRTLRGGGRLVVVDVDVPTTWFGSVCAWCGYLLFRQDEIRENIRGVLRESFDASRFSCWEQVAHDCGYVSTFVLKK